MADPQNQSSNVQYDIMGYNADDAAAIQALTDAYQKYKNDNRKSGAYDVSADLAARNASLIVKYASGNLSGPDQAAFEKWKASDPGLWAAMEPYLSKLGLSATGVDDSSKADATTLLQQFAQHMLDPNSTDPRDPYVQQVLKTAGSAAQTDARNRGLNGGYAVSNTVAANTRAMNDIYTQRQQIGAQALAQVGQLNLGQAQLAQQAYNQQYQARLAGLAATQGNNQAIGSAFGTGIGLIGSYLGIPGLNAQSGSQFGGGIAGLAGGGTQVPTYSPPALGGYGSGPSYNFTPYKGAV